MNVEAILDFGRMNPAQDGPLAIDFFAAPGRA